MPLLRDPARVARFVYTPPNAFPLDFKQPTLGYVLAPGGRIVYAYGGRAKWQPDASR